jgi:transposase
VLKTLDFQLILCYNLSMKMTAETATSDTEMMTISRAEYDAIRKENENLTRQVDWLMEQMRLAKKKAFGASSEKSREELTGQMNMLFDEPEVHLAIESKENASVAGYTRKKRAGSVDEILPENVPVEVVEHRLPESERSCPQCGTTMTEIGKDVRRSLVIVPAQVSIREDWYYTYACQNCKLNGTETPVLKTDKLPSVIPGSYASPEAIAHIAVQKYVMGSPLYRQEQELNRSGVMLSRQTMSNWLMWASEHWLTPIYKQLHEQLVHRKVLHADETTLQVLHEPGKKAQSKSYMWLYRTSGDAEHPIVLYEYKADRKSENAENFLSGFSGWLHADGYQGYHRLPENISVVGCWAHARRKFDEAVNALPKPEQAGSTALEGQQYCTKLFALEKELAGLPPEERYAQRLEREKPVLDALLAWSRTKKAAPKSALGKALYYLQEQWPYLIRYLEDGRLELSNNRAERSIKPFVMGRKNFLFANTPNGAQGSATIFSLIETAKENGLDPFRYLVWVLSEAPALASAGNDRAEKLTPAHAPESCRNLQPKTTTV